jgi:FkbM family methyltransferase
MSLLLKSGNLVIRACRHGPMAYLAQDSIIGRSFETYGEYAEDEIRLLAQIVPAGGTFIDAGANIGAHTIPLARIVGPSGAVHAFEPQRVVHAILCTNVALNNLTNVRVEWQALGDAPGFVVLPQIDYAAPGNFGGHAMRREGDGDRVRLGRIDDLDLAACHLIKIDLEGMEQAVLAGAAATIARHRPALYVEADRPDGYEALMAHLLGLGYRIWMHKAPLFRPANHFNAPTDIFNAMISLNAFCVPAERHAQLPFPEVRSPTDGLDALRRVLGLPT